MHFSVWTVLLLSERLTAGWVPGEAGRVAKQLYIPPANSHYLLIIIKSNWTEGFYIQYIHFDLIWPDQAVNINYKI